MALTTRTSRFMKTKMVFCCYNGGNNTNTDSHYPCPRFSSIPIPIPIAHPNHSLDINVNATLRELSREGRLKDALHILLATTTNSHNRSPSVDFSTCLQLLETCSANKALEEGKQLHSHINAMGLTFTSSEHAIFQSKLIHMYVNCGSLVDARKVFDCMTERNVFSWTIMISAYQKYGSPRHALTLFHKMLQPGGVLPNHFTFSSIIKACAELGDLKQGLHIHQRLFKSGFLSDVVVVNALVDMYAKCSRIHKARELFDKMTNRDAFSWTSIIAGYVQNGFLEEALKIFEQMQLGCVKPSSATFASILPACAKMGILEQGMDIHQKIVESGFSSNVVVTNALIDMYAKCGSIHMARELFDKMHNANTVSWNTMIAGYAQEGHIEKARELFDEMPYRDTFTWTTMIAGYAQNGFSEKALDTFKQMQLSGVKPNSVTFASILPACANMGALEEGMDIHQKVIESRFSADDVVVSALIDMYAKCGRIDRARALFDKMHDANTFSWTAMIAGYAQNGFVEKARDLFDKMPHPDAVSWTAMIAGYAQNGYLEEALKIFEQMQVACIKPSSATFASTLPACAKMGALEQGMDIHRRIIESGLSSNVLVTNSLIDMYGKFGNIHKARELFDNMYNANTVSWNAMIAGYAQNGHIEKAHELFDKMPHRDAVSWTAMIAGYAQNGHIEKAREFFDKMPYRNAFSWTAMIAGYAQKGFFEEALETFKQMQLSGVKPDSATFASILPACAKTGNLEQGMDIHQRIIESGFSSNVVVTNALIDMYAKCGNMDKAQELFDKMHNANTVSWTVMIAGYAMHGYSKDALKLFELMEQLGMNPNTITFVCVLFACSHAGLVDEGCNYFNSMSDSYRIIPTMDHYVCMVDLLGRAGYLEEALNYTAKMPIKPEVVVWMCLLGACRSHKNTGIGEFVATIHFVLDPKYAASYVLLSNIYADVGRWDDVQRIRKLMKDRGIKKTTGSSWIEVHKTVHVFCVGD